MSRGRLRTRIVLICATLVAAFASCTPDTCSTHGDCASGEVCAGPEQGPFHCYQECSSSSCTTADTTCTNLKSADCLGCGLSVMACFPNTPLH